MYGAVMSEILKKIIPGINSVLKKIMPFQGPDVRGIKKITYSRLALVQSANPRRAVLPPFVRKIIL